MFDLFKKSFLDLKKPRTIVICGFLLAMSLILNTQSIKIGNVTVITFSFIANSVCGFLFGPVATCILGALTDVLGHIISPKGAYFFGYTFNAMAAGILYGSFLYRKKYNTKYLKTRIILSKIIISVFINLALGTIWTAMISGKAFMVLLPSRAFKELIVIPIHCIIMFIIIKSINRYYNQIDNENDNQIYDENNS